MGLAYRSGSNVAVVGIGYCDKVGQIDTDTKREREIERVSEASGGKVRWGGVERDGTGRNGYRARETE